MKGKGGNCNQIDFVKMPVAIDPHLPPHTHTHKMSQNVEGLVAVIISFFPYCIIQKGRKRKRLKKKVIIIKNGI